MPSPEERVDAGSGGRTQKRPGRRPAAPVEQGEDTAVRPSASDVFTQLDANQHPSRRQRGQAFLQPKPPSVFLAKRLHW